MAIVETYSADRATYGAEVQTHSAEMGDVDGRRLDPYLRVRFKSKRGVISITRRVLGIHIYKL